MGVARRGLVMRGVMGAVASKLVGKIRPPNKMLEYSIAGGT